VGSLESTLDPPHRHARVAQLAEQGTLNPKVQGSTPCASTTVPPTTITEQSLANKSSHAHVVGWRGDDLSQSYKGKPWD
jgi:hypothetical protein